MNDVTKIYWVHALTPLHVGSGRGVGFIDLPVMRERITNWPFIPGSAIKGVLADNYGATENRRIDKPMLKSAFGVSGSEHSNSGSLIFTDARLICLPVRSLFGTFAWVTSPLALKRLQRDLQQSGLKADLGIPKFTSEQTLLYHYKDNTVLVDDSKAYFEDLDYDAEPDEDAAKWAGLIAGWVFPDDDTWQEEFKKRFAIVNDNSFDFLCEYATEVNARIKIDSETKAVKDRALWYEESLPAETILAGMVVCDKVYGNNGINKTDLMNEYCSGKLTLQMGGLATIGKGRVNTIFVGKEQPNENS